MKVEEDTQKVKLKQIIVVGEANYPPHPYPTFTQVARFDRNDQPTHTLYSSMSGIQMSPTFSLT